MNYKISLKTRFRKLCGKFNIKDHDKYFDELERFYEDQKRGYHNLKHIKECLKEMDTIYHELGKPLEVEMAFFYHDIIYDVSRKDNETKSSELAKERIGSEGICFLIEDTIKHREGIHPDSRYFIDVDLSILGKDWDDFIEYEKGIIHETSFQLNFNEATYKKKRKEFLAKFLERDFIFLTEKFREKYEKQARENIIRLISKL